MGATPNLQRKLQQTLGAEAASDLGSWMQSMDAHRTEIGELRREMQASFARIDERFAKIDDRFAKIDDRFAKIDDRFAKVDERFAGLGGRLDAMAATFGGRLDANGATLSGRIESVTAQFAATMEESLRKQTQFFFLAWSVILAAIIGLYART